ncbi:structural constituent of cell wall, putative [Ricinus communis]|uniref:Structural constituent of cell wall, putative n=1 Tax=Ricinus communis TaxID=3988 RepID=B9RBC9_RICCO|nr:structural constituent of cell wall, putative [Ricinus communis]|eukprot:XP_002509463.1 non-classical arabinogalactan protein 31 [Ricinus communis]
MVFAMAKALVLLQLSLLCFTVFSDEEIEAVSPIPPHHHGYSHHPAMSPTQPPNYHPPHHHHAHPPTVAPSLAPTHHHHHHRHHAPVYAPMHSPAHSPMPHSHAPVHPPVHSPPAQPHPPVKPPARSPSSHFPRSFVAVQGVVYCKSCKYSGVDTLLGASPVLGATVKLQCNNTKYPQEAKATTDKNGYFYLQAPKSITNYGAHKCKVSLVSAPNTACSKITDLHGGLSGGILRPQKKFVANKLPFVLYTVGPFAFEPKCPR